jgi:hypothetical protein
MATNKCSWKKSSPNEWNKNGIIVRVGQNLATKKWNAVAKSRMSNYYFLDEHFSSKSQALRKARAYMKKSC